MLLNRQRTPRLTNSMKKLKSLFWKLELLFGVLVANYFVGLNRVEYENDEAPWIADSDRFEMFFQTINHHAAVSKVRPTPPICLPFKT